MKYYLLLLLASLSLGVAAQKIEIIRPERGVKEITLTPPRQAAKPDPLPEQNGTYRFTHQLGVVCEAGGEQVELIQYLNVTNGLGGIFSEDMDKIAPMSAEGRLDFWGFLPNGTQRMYMQTAEQGKVVMQQSGTDPHTGGYYSLTAARFDDYNSGQLFWQNAKKAQTLTLPAHLLDNNTEPLRLDVYNYKSEEGAIQILMRDLGPASGSWNTLNQIHAATVLGGLGYVYNPQNKHVYLIFSHTNGADGCRLFSLKSLNKSFSGAGYKPVGDLMLDKLAESQREMEEERATQQREIEAEEDATLRELLQKQAAVQAKVEKKVMDVVANAALMNDMADLSGMSVSIDDQYQLADLELQIEARRLQLQLNDLTDPETRQEVQKKIACTGQQRQLWRNYRDQINALRKKYQNPDTNSEYFEKLGQASEQFTEQMLRACP